MLKLFLQCSTHLTPTVMAGRNSVTVRNEARIDADPALRAAYDAFNGRKAQ